MLAAASPAFNAAEGASGEGNNETAAREMGLPKAPAFKTSLRMQADLLAKARLANEDLYSTLQSFVCREEMQRYKGDLAGRGNHAIDIVTANLSFESGVERYSEIHQNMRMRDDMSSIPGAWSEGEFGTLLRQTAKLLSTQEVLFQAFTTLDGTEAAVYRFDVSSSESPWDLEVGGHHYHLAFQTDVWISTTTGEIVKIARKSLDIPAETRISGIEWSVSLQSVELNDKSWSLPKTGQYAVYYDQSNRREWNELSFTNYRRYGAEASLRFDEMK
jgi:hypothetical protein